MTAWDSWTSVELYDRTLKHDSDSSSLLRSDVKEWLEENIGPQNHFTRDEPRPANGVWQFYHCAKGRYEFHFKDPHAALMFKLVWSGVKPIN